MPPAVPEIIVIPEDSALLEVEQAHLSMIEEPRIVVGRVLLKDLNIPISKTADPKLLTSLKDINQSQIALFRWKTIGSPTNQI